MTATTLRRAVVLVLAASGLFVLTRAAAGQATSPPASDAAIEQRLARPMPEVRFVSIPLDKVLEFLATAEKLNIQCDWAALGQMGIRKETEVTLLLRDVPLQVVLREVLVAAAGREGLLDYAVGDGAIRIAPIRQLAGKTYAKTYDLRGLGAAARNVMPPPQNLIRQMVCPDAWEPTGPFRLTRQGDSLNIVASARCHRDVAALLVKLQAPGRLPSTDPAVARKLSAVVPELNFQRIDLGQALSFLRDMQKVNIVANWGAMEAAGINRTAEVTLRLANVPFKTALDQVLVAAAGGRKDVLGYTVRDGVIKISTPEDLVALMYVDVYDARNRPERTPAARARLLESLRTTVAPGSWVPTGSADVIDFAGLLVVRQTYAAHVKVAEFLAVVRP